MEGIWRVVLVQTKITQSVVQNISPQQKVFRIYDTLLKGLVLVVRPSGKKTWYVDYKRSSGKRTDHLIGVASLFTVLEAREQAREFLAAIARGEDPKAPTGSLTLGEFIRDIYSPWVSENRRTGHATIMMIQRAFKSFMDIDISKITIAQLEQWRTQQKKKRGIKASSLNREVTALKAALNWAVRLSIIEKNPMEKFKPLPERDSEKIVRYLSNDERSRLMATLDEREGKMREERNSYNEWRKARGLPTLPKFSHFTDHLKPMIILSLSTGIRRNALFSLEWRDVSFADRILKLRAETSKSDKSNYIPLNLTAYDILQRWHEQSKATKPSNLVFPSPKNGEKMDNCQSAWERLLKDADIENFRWHDMRHDFASQLVMKGVDLNTVRELLGHADLKMTLRYAHLAPEAKMKAVKMLDALCE